MLPSKFCEIAAFPPRWQEKDLQEYIANRLRDRGFSVQLEVKANGGRADIVTSWQGGAIVEVKKYLDRNTIYQASGQLGLYGLNNKHKLIIMGFLSPDANEQQSAFTTASMLEQNPRIQVIFVNLVEEWQPGKTFGRLGVFEHIKRIFTSTKKSKQSSRITSTNFLQFIFKHPLLVGMGLLLIFLSQPTIKQNEHNRVPSSLRNFR